MSPANNQNGPAFGLYIVYPRGEVQPLSLQSSLSRGLVKGVQVATLPAYEGSWTVTVAARAAGKLPYRLVSITGQILEEGEWNVPSAGTWIYALPAHSYSSGMYLLQIGEASYQLLKVGIPRRHEDRRDGLSISLIFFVSIRKTLIGSRNSYTNSGQRVFECRRVELGVAAAPPSGGHAHLLLTLRRPLT